MEQNTNYTQKCALYLGNSPTFWKIYEYNINSYPQTTYSYGQIFSGLSSGTSIIKGDDLLRCYMAAYAGHHYHKLINALPTLLQNIPTSSTIDILDYGCGQAVASAVFLDLLNQQNKKLNINSVKLIEPSFDALQRGEFHINYFLNAYGYPNTKIQIINKELDYLLPNELQTQSQSIKIHLFSNILDVEGFDLKNLHGKIVNSQSGLNYFLCVGAYNPLRQRLLDFCALFSNAKYQTLPNDGGKLFCKIFNIQTHQYETDYPVTKIQKLFSCIL